MMLTETAGVNQVTPLPGDTEESVITAGWTMQSANEPFEGSQLFVCCSQQGILKWAQMPEAIHFA